MNREPEVLFGTLARNFLNVGNFMYASNTSLTKYVNGRINFKLSTNKLSSHYKEPVVGKIDSITVQQSLI